MKGRISSLLLEVRTHDRKIVLGQAANNFFLKIISGRSRRGAIPLLESRAALIDILFQAVVKIFISATFRNLRLIVELDFIDQ